MRKRRDVRGVCCDRLGLGVDHPQRAVDLPCTHTSDLDHYMAVHTRGISTAIAPRVYYRTHRRVGEHTSGSIACPRWWDFFPRWPIGVELLATEHGIQRLIVAPTRLSTAVTATLAAALPGARLENLPTPFTVHTGGSRPVRSAYAEHTNCWRWIGRRTPAATFWPPCNP
jgi:hypothetical protein